jgi:hypothetical protein
MKKILMTETQLKNLSNQIKEEYGLAGNPRTVKFENSFKKSLFGLAVLMIRYDDRINSYQDLLEQIHRMVEYHTDSHNYSGFMTAIMPELDKKRKKR